MHGGGDGHILCIIAVVIVVAERVSVRRMVRRIDSVPLKIMTDRCHCRRRIYHAVVGMMVTASVGPISCSSSHGSSGHQRQ